MGRQVFREDASRGTPQVPRGRLGPAFRHVLFPLVAALVACGGKTSELPADGVSVPECDAYAARISSCLGRDQPAAKYAVTQAASLTSADDAQRARMKAICARDLERLKSSCH
jgi:hypothetical protein